MKKVLILAPSNLPIPAVKGGAVETGIDQIVIENEKSSGVHIDVVSFYNAEACKKSRKYNKTSFWFYKKSWVDDGVCFFLKIINNIFGRIKINACFNTRPLFIKYVCKNFDLKSYDAILIKNAVNYVLPLSKYTKNNIYLQLHNDFLNIDTCNAQKIVDKCKLIISNSKYIKDRILTTGAIDENDVLVNMNCLGEESFAIATKKQKEDILLKYGIENNNKIILFSGRLIKEKGIKELLYAVKGLGKKDKWKLIIVGSKWYSANKKDNFIRELEGLSNKMPNNIVFSGYIPHSKISCYNSIADVVVIPSVWEEPAGRVALEAAAVGTPVIIANSGGLKEYIDIDNSIVVEKDDKFVENLRESIDDILFGGRFSSSSSKKALISFAKKFSSKRYYDEIMGYLGVLKR